MITKNKNKLSLDLTQTLIAILKARFEKNLLRHKQIQWEKVEGRLQTNPGKLWSLNEMETTGGEPDVTGFNENGAYIFMDCASESPKGRRSLCYDREGLDARKEFKPGNSALDMAHEMGVEILTEDQYRTLQQLGPFDTKTSSWLKTPVEIRKAGGAIFGDYRYGNVFVYHNSAPSYYASRGFRAVLFV
jgi:hypothetical protein